MITSSDKGIYSSTECTEIPSQKYRNYSGYSTVSSLYLSEQQRPIGLQLPNVSPLISPNHQKQVLY
jgi:hypothetical protein